MAGRCVNAMSALSRQLVCGVGGGGGKLSSVQFWRDSQPMRSQLK